MPLDIFGVRLHFLHSRCLDLPKYCLFPRSDDCVILRNSVGFLVVLSASRLRTFPFRVGSSYDHDGADLELLIFVAHHLRLS